MLERNFQARGPNELWVSDITYVPTASGFLYLTVILDAWSRKVVGWSMQTHLKAGLVLRSLDMAVTQRRPAHVILHSDQGTQYTSIAFGLRCKHAGGRPSMGSVGDAYDNALCESFFASLECELLEQTRFRNQPRRGWPSSTTPKGGTIPTAATPVSARNPLSTSRGTTLMPLESASGYPSTGRGQLQKGLPYQDTQLPHESIADQPPEPQNDPRSAQLITTLPGPSPPTSLPCRFPPSACGSSARPR